MASPPPTNGFFFFLLCISTFTECSRNAIRGAAKVNHSFLENIKGKLMAEKIERMEMEINYGCQIGRTSCALGNFSDNNNNGEKL
jgi:hypothetical protein